MKKIIIESKTYGTFEVLLDDEDYEWAKEHKWSVKKDYSCKREKYYVLRHARQPDGKQKKVLLHREIMNTPRGLVTDHLNGNGLDNRRANLRVCTDRENQVRKRKHIDGKNKFLGVYKTDKRYKKKWYAQYAKNNLGYYHDETEAAYHRDLFVVEKFGMDVELNFPEKLNEYLNTIKQDMVNL